MGFITSNSQWWSMIITTNRNTARPLEGIRMATYNASLFSDHLPHWWSWLFNGNGHGIAYVFKQGWDRLCFPVSLHFFLLSFFLPSSFYFFNMSSSGRTIAFFTFLYCFSVCSAAASSMIVKHSRQAVPSTFVVKGPAAANDSITIRMALTSNNKEGLQQKLQSISNPSSADYGKWLSKEEVGSCAWGRRTSRS